LFPSGNSSEDYLSILQNVPTKRAAAYMRGQWGASGGQKSAEIAELAAEQAVHVIQTGFSGKQLFDQMGIL